MARVSRSGYHAWASRAPSSRCVDDAYLADTIRDIYRRSRCTYGSSSGPRPALPGRHPRRVQTRRSPHGRARPGRRAFAQEVAPRPPRRRPGSGPLTARLQREAAQRALGGRHHRVSDRRGQALLVRRQGFLRPRARRLVDGDASDLRVGHRGRLDGRGAQKPGDPAAAPQRQGVPIHLARLHQPGSTSSASSPPTDPPGIATTVATTRPWRPSGPRSSAS
jgi:hypothetical protein